MSILDFCVKQDKSFNSDDKRLILKNGRFLLEEITKRITYTKPGSVKYAYFGRLVSDQSVNVRLGEWGEKWFEYLVEITPNFTMLPHGVLKGIGKNGEDMDVDFLFTDDKNMIIYYRELKGNIKLDTEKLPATCDKINYLKEYLEKNYPEYTLNYACLNWSVWDKEIYKSKGNTEYLGLIKKFENKGVSVTHASEMFEILGIDFIDEKVYCDYLRELGKLIGKRTNAAIN